MRFSFSQRPVYYVFWLVFVGTAVILLTGRPAQADKTTVQNAPVTLASPQFVAGSSGKNDARDADVYPAVAFDAVSNRYLVVWMTPRNATSTGSGLDVYGIFLSADGQPLGSSFRISDSNTAARNGKPAVVAGAGEFVVAWTSKNATCRLSVQRVVDGTAVSDTLLLSSSGNIHSPALAYDPTRQQYALAYVLGNDYLPPALYGADAADCGSDAQSESQIGAATFALQGNTAVLGSQKVVSEGNGGAFRPDLAYSPTLNRYFVAWEDRRDAVGDFEFDVYGQLLTGGMADVGANLALASGGNYANDDPDVSWTPRPAVVAGDTQFLTAWFERATQSTAVIWSVSGQFLGPSALQGGPFSIAAITYASPHPSQPPTGFLDLAYSPTMQEYLAGITTYLESLWGFLSSARVQRLTADGQLLQMDGTNQSGVGVGSAVGFSLDDQLSISLATNSSYLLPMADYAILYSMHELNEHAQDFDIWRGFIKSQSADLRTVFLPLVQSP